MSHCDISVQQCGRNKANHKKATMFWRQKCAEFSKKPHKIEILHILHVFILKVCSRKPLIYIGKVPFCTFAHFSKTFCDNISLKIFQLYICALGVKIDYYSRIPMGVACTFLKPKMCKMCKSAITNTFLTLKMCRNMCIRENGYNKRYSGEKYDDRRGFLG